MDISSIITELRAELELVSQAILTLERVAASTRGNRRGRPPKWMSAAAEAIAEPAATPTRRKRAVAGGKKRAAKRR